MSAQASLLDVPATAPRKLTFEFAVPLSSIEERPGFNPRADYGDHDNTFAALVESVRARGVLQPPLLRPLNLSKFGSIPVDGTAQFAVVAGHRRIAAAREAKQTELRVAVVVDAEYEPTESESENRKLEAEALAAYTEREQLLDALTENSLRRDLNPMEQARAAKRLAEMGLDQEAIGKAFGGKSQTWVSRTLSLLELHPAISCHLVNGTLTREHGVELLRLKDFPDGIVSALANKAIKDELSVAAVRGLASTMIERRDGKAQPSLLEEKPVEPMNAPPHTPATEAPAPVRHEAPARGESDTRHTVENQRASAEATRTLEVGPRPALAPEPTDLEKWAVGAFGGVQSALEALRSMHQQVVDGFAIFPDTESVIRLAKLVEVRRAEDPKFAGILAGDVVEALIYRRCVELGLLTSSGKIVASAPYALDEKSVEGESAPTEELLDGFKGCMAAIRASFTPKRLEQLFSGRDSERVQAVRWVCNLLELEKYEEPTVEEWNLARDYLLGHADVMPSSFELRNVPDFHKAILNALKMSNTEAHVTASMSYGEMIDALSRRMSEGGGSSGPKNGWWSVDWKGGTKPKLELSWRWIKPDGEYSDSKSVTLTGKNLYEAIVAALNWKESSK